MIFCAFWQRNSPHKIVEQAGRRLDILSALALEPLSSASLGITDPKLPVDNNSIYLYRTPIMYIDSKCPGSGIVAASFAHAAVYNGTDSGGLASNVLLVTPSPIDRGTGYCFRSIYLFISLFLCFFVSKITRKLAGPICMKFSGKVWSDPGTTWLHFFVNSEKPRDAAMLNTGTGSVVLSHHSLLPYLWSAYCFDITLSFYLIVTDTIAGLTMLKKWRPRAAGCRMYTAVGCEENVHTRKHLWTCSLERRDFTALVVRRSYRATRTNTNKLAFMLRPPSAAQVWKAVVDVSCRRQRVE